MHRDMKTTVLASCAVDVGYANVKYSSGRAHVGGQVEIRTGVFPALAPVLSNDGFQIRGDSPAADGTVVTLGGTRYFSGKGVHFHASGSEPRTVPSNYCETDEYMALLCGALHYIAKDAGANHSMVIETLVLGLPLSTWRQHHKALAARATGEHVLGTFGGGDLKCLVHVKHVTVIVQPLGALYHHGIGASEKPMAGWTMVVDAGGGTLDWFVSQRMQPNWPRSGAHNKSMLACCYAVADQINPDWKDQIEIVNRIDFALRNSSDHFEVQGVRYPLDKYRAAVEAVLRESVNKMMASVNKTDNLDYILVTGGAAGIFYTFLCDNYPNLKPVMHVDPDNLYANVKGFQIAAELVHEEVR
ncbi:hypothetical protein [Hydrogenophaga sp. BPS33]|uniref:ParM/StbA family protein n=1 Tax=Hydrogenophaga sp. BPS33 TaxID=2651974 RepID=UPI00131F8C68|nr:hypothetical protein [Hydrogenophaga sp. BPS33]QHE89241.1 hypothetical protein F9K07_30105 [Hydrogenophaga sp. BPS33]